MLLLHDMVIAPPSPAAMLHKRRLPDDIPAILALPAPKRLRPGVPPSDDDGAHLVLPRLVTAAGTGGDRVPEDDGALLWDDEDTDDTTPRLSWSLPRLELQMGSAYIPKEEGVHPMGEDAHFMSPATNAFGVADGVGSWTRRGVDAGVFSRQLMGLCKAELEARPFSGSTTASWLQGVLERALLRTTARGSSTALLAAVEGRLLRAVCVGDSGFLVVRGDGVVYRSPPHQRRFNWPYQLGLVDRRDPPDCAQWLAVEVEPGDVIVAGTDGLFDNLFDAQIRDALATTLESGKGAPQELAEEVPWAAVWAYEGEEETPYTMGRREAGLPTWCGGKPDDVTVVVAIVQWAAATANNSIIHGSAPGVLPTTSFIY
ncbi:hypothetical protein Taro_018517 [Colocasia esculenta]|uniref:Protein phosphatase n=1 Tax=Colocasia esculenta TaxID=4460 RepID=A0A843V2P9_COLES|nr:hypothetical protein [Colocasia esculenta]